LRSFSLEPQVGGADADWIGVPRIGAARLATVFAIVAFGVALVAARNDDRLTQWVSNVGLVISPVAAAGACWWHARRAPLGSRRAWFLIGLGSLSWGLGQFIWTIYESFLHREVPFPSLADAGYLGAVPLLAAGLLSFPTSRLSVAGLLRTVLDGLATASSLLVVSWALILSTIFRGESALGSKLILLAYPAGDVVVITIVLSAISRARKGSERQMRSLQLLCVGLSALAISDSGFAYMTASSSYASGNVIDLGWFAGFAIVAAAALGHHDEVAMATEDVPASRGALLLPYIPVVVAAATSVTLAVRGDLDAVVAGATAVLLLLLMLRQVLTLLENVSLTRNLEARVHNRTTELLRSEERFRSLVQNSSDVVVILDNEGSIRYVSPSAEKVFGFREGLTGTSFLDLVDEDHRYGIAELLYQCALSPGETTRAELAVMRSDGTRCQTEATVTNLLEDEPVQGLVLNMRDVSDRKVLERELLQLAFSDSLTGLANRARFTERLGVALEHGRYERRRVAVLYMDLDGFKEVNDSLGHSAGDELLVAVADRLRSAVRGADLVARLGGDEFGILLEDLTGEPEALVAAERVRKVLSQPLTIQGRDFIPVASIGVALTDRGDETSEEMLRNADMAMYRAKAAGAGAFERYDEAMHADTIERMRMQADLRQAVGREELRLHYQPIVDLTTGAVQGLEALVRWMHPTMGLVPPSRFVPLAEDNGMIMPIGEWAMRQACMETVQLREATGIDLTVSVNLSARQFQRSNPVSMVEGALVSSGLSARNLVLEMTESVLMDHGEVTLSTLEQLRHQGVRLAIDDFGTGYSSLSYLHRFPIDILKIDRSFISRLTSDHPNESLAASIVRIADGLQLETVAEGVEDPSQLQYLRHMGCQKAQGFLFAAPARFEDMAEILLDLQLGIRHPTAAA